MLPLDCFLMVDCCVEVRNEAESLLPVESEPGAEEHVIRREEK